MGRFWFHQEIAGSFSFFIKMKFDVLNMLKILIKHCQDSLICLPASFPLSD